jgi:4-amino-4-deoxy-L-arabinose transferase-like glycosyltransferase
VQAVVGSATAAALAGAGRRMFGGRAGLAAGLVAALYGTLVFFDGELLIPNLLLALLTWSLFLLTGRPRLRNGLAAAALLGLAAAARPNALVLLPVLLAAWIRAGRCARRCS